MKLFGGLCSVVLLAGCAAGHALGPPAKAKEAPISSSVPAPASPAITAKAQCPSMEPTALELAAPAPDPRTIALSEVYPRHEARVPGVTPRALDLGRVGVDPHNYDWGSGMTTYEWLDLSRSWVEGGLGPEVMAPFARWEAARAKRTAWLGRSSLLAERAGRLYMFPPADGGFQRQCALDAQEYATAVAEGAEREASYEAASLVASLEARSDPSERERLLLGYLLAQRGSWSKDSTTLSRSLSLLTGVARDTKSLPEVRAHAEYLAANLYCGSARVDECEGALKRVVALTKDRDLEFDALFQQMENLVNDEDARQELLEHIFARSPLREGDWRAFRTLHELAEGRNRRGAFKGALDAAVACLRVASAGCARPLARALSALGGAPEGMNIPLPFLGPLAVEIMEGSIDAHDHDDARRAGEMVLTRLPEARETPQVLKLLARSTSDDRASDAFLERHSRVVAPDSPWSLAQRGGRAPNDDIEGLELSLRRLLLPLPQYSARRAWKDDDLRQALRMRVQILAGLCTRELTTAARELHVRIDTSPAVPTLSASGARGKDVDCLSRQVVRLFRNVEDGPLDVTLFIDHGSFQEPTPVGRTEPWELRGALDRASAIALTRSRRGRDRASGFRSSPD